jgi:TolC family type I secretion outer membrane protein
MLCRIEWWRPQDRPPRRGRAARLVAPVILAGLPAVAALPAAAQTLTQALAEAYNTNPQLLEQRALLRATDEQVPQALSGWRPTVNFTGQLGGNRAGFTASTTPSQYSTFMSNTVNLQVTQSIYSGGRTLSQTRQAVNTVESTRAQTLAVETSVFQAVSQAYLDVVRDQALVEVNRNNVEVLRKQLEATQDRFRVGEVTRTDVAQAESSLAQAIGTLTSAEGTLAQSRAEYVRAIGRPPGVLLLPRERPTLPATREEAQTLAANNNFNVISANFAQLAARDNIDVVKSQLLPQLSLVGNAGREFAPSVTLSGARENFASIQAQLTWNLYEGGAISSQTRQAQQTVGQRLSQVDDARRA